MFLGSGYGGWTRLLSRQPQVASIIGIEPQSQVLAAAAMDGFWVMGMCVFCIEFV